MRHQPRHVFIQEHLEKIMSPQALTSDVLLASILAKSSLTVSVSFIKEYGMLGRVKATEDEVLRAAERISYLEIIDKGGEFLISPSFRINPLALIVENPGTTQHELGNFIKMLTGDAPFIVYPISRKEFTVVFFDIQQCFMVWRSFQLIDFRGAKLVSHIYYEPPIIPIPEPQIANVPEIHVAPRSPTRGNDQTFSISKPKLRANTIKIEKKDKIILFTSESKKY